MKPMMLISVIILLIFLVQSLYSARGKERMAEKNLDILSTATNILLILSNSEQCIAHTSAVTDKTQGNIIEVTKLNEFDVIYDEIEPECARNYDFGWRVMVEEIEENMEEQVKEWSFGSKEFSTDKSLDTEVEFWIPVALRYSKEDVRLGKMNIKVVDGELEKLSGFFDWICKMGQMKRLNSFSTELFISQPVTYNSLENKICIGGSCRKMNCELLYFDGIGSEGTYKLVANYQEPDKLLVEI
jgi:hypothetical protein